MNERDFKAKLRRLILPHCYIQSVSSLGVGGTPDLWISGKQSDLWLEVKFDDKTKGPILPKLRPLQNKWLNERQAEGRKVAVLVGTGTSEGIYYVDGLWNFKKDGRQPLDAIIKRILEDVM